MVTSCSGVDQACTCLSPFPQANSPMWLRHSGLTMMYVMRARFPMKFTQGGVLN